jgi:hypothetical protein
MKLWHLTLVREWGEHQWYDCACGFVVRAEDEAAARKVIVDLGDESWEPGAGNEGASFWADPAKAKCVELTADGESGVIIRDFAAA